MTERENKNNKEEFYKKILGFFDQRVLAAYRNEPDKYILETDHFEGRLHSVYNEDGNAIADPIDIRFGYRARVNGDLALVVFLPDLFDRSSTHVKIWAGYHLDETEMAPLPDHRFETWKARYMEGSWEVENGPKYHLEQTIATINALCDEMLNQGLFRYPSNPSLNFPIAQNTHAYQDAHRELYGFIIDGLHMPTIALIAKSL